MHKTSNSAIVLVLFAAFAGPRTLCSEPVPTQAEVNKLLLQELRALRQEVKKLQTEVKELEFVLRTNMAPQERLSVPGFAVEGSTLGEGVLEGALQPLILKKLTLEQLHEKVKKTVQDEYAESGIRGVQVIIPPQAITDEPLSVQVVEPTIGEFAIEGTALFNALKLERFFGKELDKIQTEEGVLIADELESRLDWANRHPDRQITAVLNPGEEPGVTDINLRVEDRETPIPRVSPLAHYALEVNNTGTSNDRFRMMHTLQYTNFFGRDHTGTAQWLFDPSNFEQIQIIGGSYVFPDFLTFIPWDVSLAFYGGWSEVTTDTVIDNLKIIGEGHAYGAQIRSELPSVWGCETFAYFGVETSQLNNSLEFGTTTSIDSEVGALPLYTGLSIRKRDRWGGTYGNFSWRGNLAGVVDNGEDKHFRAFREDSESEFHLFHGSLERYQKFLKGWTLYGKVEGQLTDNRLIPAEQSRLGGAYSVRGYEQAELSGDDTLFIRTELRSPDLPILFSRVLKDQEESAQLVGFLDFGVAEVNDAIEGDPNDGEEIYGTGVGIRYQLTDYFTGMIDIGFPLADGPETDHLNPFLHFSAQLHF